jgi:hypothetical protein
MKCNEAFNPGRLVEPGVQGNGRRMHAEDGHRTIAATRLPRPLAVAVAVALIASGCIGPRSLELTRLRYDEAVHETSEQQWLRNIVRLRYGELPTMLDVSAITSQFELAGRGGLTGGQERDSANSSLFGDMSLQFRDAPTLSYTPRDPSELTRVMVAPVGISALGLMANSGWDVEDVLRLMVGEVNGLENMPGSEALIPRRIPPPTLFPEMVRLVGRLRGDHLAVLKAAEDSKPVSPEIAADLVDGSDFVQAASHNLEYRPAESTGALVLTRTGPGYRLAFSPAAAGHPEADALRGLLRLAPGRLEYDLVRENIPGGLELLPLPDALESVHLRTRTLLEMAICLSKGVVVPEEHARRGLAAQTVGPDGVVFDWTCTTGGLFRVCSQKKRPKGAAVAIEHEGYWYYIAAADKRSQATLGLLQALFNIQLSEPRKSGPVLTLPVGL